MLFLLAAGIVLVLSLLLGVTYNPLIGLRNGLAVCALSVAGAVFASAELVPVMLFVFAGFILIVRSLSYAGGSHDYVSSR